jgi:hypothetical protein
VTITYNVEPQGFGSEVYLEFSSNRFFVFNIDFFIKSANTGCVPQHCGELAGGLILPPAPIEQPASHQLYLLSQVGKK